MSDLVAELFLLGATLASILLFLMAAWCLAADLRVAATFPISSGPFSNWLIWLSAAVGMQVSRRIVRSGEVLRRMATAFRLQTATAVYACVPLIRDLKSTVLNSAVVHRQLNSPRF